MILWYVDRFGMPGQFRAIWATMLKRAGLPPIDVRLLSLHRDLGGTLLMRHGNRIAPTWIPERGMEIRQHIRQQVTELAPKCIVLAAPEALAVTPALPEYATLQQLRGSVYDVAGVPAIVMLPMSAWVTKVSTTALQAANYGESDEAKWMESLDREAESSAPGNSGVADSADAASDSLPMLAREPMAGSPIDDDSEDDDDFGSGTENTSHEESDNFWYEPVMVPVGKFMLQADAHKLSRLYHGRAGEHFDAY